MPFFTLTFARVVSRTVLRSFLAVLLTTPAAQAAVELPLGEGRVIRFADVSEGVAAITARDDYIQRLSPFDRQVRPQTDRAVSEEEFLAFLAQHVIPWTDQDIARIRPIVADIARQIEPYELPLPSVILLVKTTGGEEARAAYCRGPAIVLPQNIVSGGRLAQILPHELFHVLSNQNPDLRRALYATIGFEPTDEVSLPDTLAPRKITNPDAPRNDSFVTVTHNGQQIELMPVLYANAPESRRQLVRLPDVPPDAAGKRRRTPTAAVGRRPAGAVRSGRGARLSRTNRRQYQVHHPPRGSAGRQLRVPAQRPPRLADAAGGGVHG